MSSRYFIGGLYRKHRLKGRVSSNLSSLLCFEKILKYIQMRYIHQIWFDFNGSKPDSSVERVQLRDAILTSNSNYKYKIWSLEEALELTKTEFPDYFEFLNCTSNRNIVKCDFFRYLLMYLFGGVYMDIDFYVLHSLDHLIYEFRGSDVILTRESHNCMEAHGTLHNGFLYSIKPGIHFWKSLCDSIIQEYKCRDMLSITEQEVYGFTGTKFLCTKYLEHVENYQTFKHTRITVMPFHKVCNHWFVSKNWRRFHSTNKKDNEDNVSDPTLNWIFLTVREASLHSDELIKSGSHAICIRMSHGSYWK